MHAESTHGVTVAVHDLGGEGEPLLIAHATGFCGGTYRPLAERLAGQFHVWALDFRGHGDSTSPTDGDFGWRGMADDVLSAASAIGAERIHGMGHSMGGAALLLAEVLRPGLLRSAYLFEPIVIPADAPGAPETPLSAAARRRRPAFPSKAAALARYSELPQLGVLRADCLAAYVEHGFGDGPDGTAVLKCLPEDEARTFGAEAKVTLRDVEGLDVPATIAVGERESHMAPAQMAPGLAAALPRARLVRYPFLGHFGPLQDPDTIAEHVTAGTRPARPG